MREELTRKIEEKFAFMNRDSIEGSNLYKQFGFEMGDGWFSVIWSLCEDISSAYERAGKEIDLIPAQCKEKFGTLRFYYDVTGEKKAIHAFDCIGESSFRFQNTETDLYREIAGIVHKWEEKSGHVCEKCGAEGSLRTDLGWICTLCDDCYKERKRR